MKKFIEDDIDVKFDSPIHFIQSSVCLLVTAPFKFVMSASSKILYLPKAAQTKVMFNSAVVGTLVTGLNVAYQMFFDCFSLWKGKLPVVVLGFVTVLLWVGYSIVMMNDFSFHSQLEAAMNPESETQVEPLKEEQVEEPVKARAEEPMKAPSVDDLFEDSTELDDQVAQEFFNMDLAMDESVPKVDTGKLKNVDGGLDIGLVKDSNGMLSDEEMIGLQREMDSCTDPSKFLSNKLLARFSSERIIEDEVNLEALNLGIIPNSFRVFA